MLGKYTALDSIFEFNTGNLIYKGYMIGAELTESFLFLPYKDMFMRNMTRMALFAAISASATNAMAAFIESAIGPAVIGDASAVYYNPAALSLLKGPQFLLAGAYVPVRFSFNGSTFQNATHITETGSATSKTIYKLPAGFFSLPLGKKLIMGLGVLYPDFGKQNFSTQSIVRHFGTYSSVSSLDLIPSLTYKMNDKFSIGAGLDFEEIRVTLNSMVGAPAVGVPDYTLTNHSKKRGVGAHAGILVQPKRGTIIGLTYHSKVRFNPVGRSTFQAPTPFTVNDFHFNLSMPASTVLSVDQYLNPDFGIIGTVQYMQWSVIKVLNLQNVAIVRRGVPSVLPLSQIFYNQHDTWRFQLGTHYAASPKFTMRAAAAYDQDPNNPAFQLAPATNIILSTNGTYKFNDTFGFELGYAHVFYTNQTINIHAAANTILGRTSGGRNAYVAKLIFSFS